MYRVFCTALREQCAWYQDQSDTFNDTLGSRQHIHAIYREINGQRAGDGRSIRHICKVY